MGWLEGVRVDHVPFGVVLGEDKKKFKTRSGDTVKLVDLLDEGVKRAQKKLEEKAKERNDTFSTEEIAQTSKALAYGCIKVNKIYSDPLLESFHFFYTLIPLSIIYLKFTI